MTLHTIHISIDIAVLEISNSSTFVVPRVRYLCIVQPMFNYWWPLQFRQISCKYMWTIKARITTLLAKIRHVRVEGL